MTENKGDAEQPKPTRLFKEIDSQGRTEYCATFRSQDVLDYALRHPDGELRVKCEDWPDYPFTMASSAILAGLRDTISNAP